MYVPQVDVFVRDLHGALPVDVQVRGGHQVHVETLCEEERQIRLFRFYIEVKASRVYVSAGLSEGLVD